MFDRLSSLDILVMALYVVAMIGIGIYVGKRVKNSKDFTTAGQSMSLGVVIGSTVATCLGSSIAFGNMELVHKYGLSGLTSAVFWYVGWLFLVALAKPLRDSGATSIPTFLAQRYDASTRKISSLCTVIMALSSCAANFIAIGVMTQALGICDSTTGTIVGAVIIVLFTIFSGLWGVAITDTIQSVILVIGIGIIIPVVSFSSAGGFTFVMDNTPAIRLDPLLGMAPLTMFGWFLANTLACGAHPAYAQRIFAAKDTKTAQMGTLISNGVCVCVMVVAALPAFTIPFLFPDMQLGSQFAPTFIADYFPPLMRGLLMAALLGLLLTTGDTFLLLLASTITQDVIPLFKKTIEDRTMLAINRGIVAVGAVVIVLMGLYWNSIYELFKIGASAYGAGMFLPLFLGCFWKKAQTPAINAAMLTGCLVSFIWDYLFKRQTGIDGVILGAGLCFAISVFGSLWLAGRSGASARVSGRD